MNEDINVYKTRKLVYQIMFDFSDVDYKNDSDLFSLVILKSLQNIIEYYVENNYLSDSVITNINNYLLQARDYKDKNREKRIEIINSIIITMNSQKQDESFIFYRLELLKRRNDKMYMLCSDDVVKKEIKNINDSICHDLCVLVSHTDIITDEEFANEYLPYFINSNLYYESINAMLEENPIVFKDKIFYDRVNQVLGLNKEIYKGTEEERPINRLNKKMIRQINNKVKKYK